MTKRAMRNTLRTFALLLLIPVMTILGVAPSQAAKLNPPSNITPANIAGSATSITVSFTPPSNGTATSYDVFVYSGSGSNFTTLVKTVTNYIRPNPITGLTPNTSYKVRVQAIAVPPGSRDTSSNVSALSATSVTLGTSLATPSAPTVAATANTLKSIDVSWSAITNASSYSLNLYNSSDVLQATISGLTGTSTTITTSNYSSFADSTAYKLSITAIGDGSNYLNSLESAKATATTNAAPALTTITVQPTNQSSAYASTAIFGVTATSSDSGTLGYQWQVSINSGVDWSNVSTGTGGTTSSYTTASLARAANGYRYRVNVTNTKNGATSSAVTSNAVTLTVAKAERAALSNPVLSVSTATDTGGVYSQALTVISASGGSVVDGLSITGVVNGDATGCSFSAGTLTASTAGTCTLTVTQAADDNYNATSTTATFTFRARSTVSTLGSLTITPGTTTPGFSSASTSYSVSISSTVTSLTITAAPTNQYATMTLNGSTLASNSATTFTLDPTLTTQVITIAVTPESGSVRNYSITVKKVVIDKSSEVLAPDVAPTPSPVKSTTQQIQTPAPTVLPRINTLVNTPPGLSITSGPALSTVTINGSGFNSVLSVKLNGVNITPTNPALITPTAITVTIPVGARSGTIMVTTTKGSVSTPKFTVT